MKKAHQNHVHINIDIDLQEERQIRLNISQDKRYIFIYNFYQKDNQTKFQFQAWDAKTFMPYDLFKEEEKSNKSESQKLINIDQSHDKDEKKEQKTKKQKIHDCFKTIESGQGEIQSIDLVGHSRYLMITKREFQNKKNYLRFLIINLMTGEVDLDLKNIDFQKGDQNLGLENKEFMIIGLLCEGTKNFIELLNNTRGDAEESMVDQSQQLINRTFVDCDLYINFIVVAKDQNEVSFSVVNDSKENCFKWTKVKINLTNLKENSDGSQIKYILHKTKRKFKQLYKYDMDDDQSCLEEENEDNLDQSVLSQNKIEDPKSVNVTQSQINRQNRRISSKFKYIPKKWFIKEVNYKKGNQLQETETINWEGDISISSDRSLNELGFMNQYQKQFIYYHYKKKGPQWHTLTILPQTFFPNTKEEGKRIVNKNISHGRNESVKDNIFLVLRNIDRTVTYCYYSKLHREELIEFQNDYEFSFQDTFYLSCCSDNNDEQFSLSSITLSDNDQELLMKTRKQLGRKNIEDIERKTLSQHQQYNYPALCYNVGIYHLIIQNTLGDAIQFVLELDYEMQQEGSCTSKIYKEEFLAFVDYKDYNSIGFEASLVDTAGVTSFAYLTYSQADNIISLNVLLMDTYHEKPSIKVFKSQKKWQFDLSIDQDLIKKCIVYSTSQPGSISESKIRLLVQYTDHFNQYTIKRKSELTYDQTKNNRFDHSKDSQNIEFSSRQSLTYFVLDRLRGHIYYVLEFAGQCQVMEINPVLDQRYNHTQIFEIKSDFCQGFQALGNKYLFMDSKKIVTILQRSKDGRQLEEVVELNLKDKDRSYLVLNPWLTDIILHDEYFIFKSKIFYIFDKNPLQTGILDMEELADKEKYKNDPDDEEEQEKERDIKYVKGPYNFSEANEFGVIVRQEDTKLNFCKILKLPDGKSQKIIGDKSKEIKMVTWIVDDPEIEEDKIKRESDPGQILVLVKNKFLLFDSTCEFVNRIKFYKQNKKEKKKNANSQRYIERHKIPDDETAKMEFYDLSENGKYYIFISKSFEHQYESTPIEGNSYCSSDIDAIYLFEMVSTGVEDIDYGKIEHKKMFKLKLKLGKQDKKTKKLQDLFGKQIQARKNHVHQFKMQVSNDGCIHYIETYYKNSKKEQPLTSVDMQNFNIHVDIKKIRMIEGKELPEIYSFESKIVFQNCLLLQNQQYYDDQQKLQDKRIEKEQHNQKDLPFQLKDFTIVQSAQKKRKMMTDKRNEIVKTYAFDVLNDDNEIMLFVTCGRDIMYRKICPDGDLEIEKTSFQKLDFAIDSDAEIADILDTSIQDVFQFIIRDEDKELVLIVTWDMKHQKEIKMLQVPIVGNDRPGKHVVRGMNQKMNYFLDSYFIYDLENSFPFEQVTNLSDGNYDEKKIQNAKKVYINGTRSLSIEDQSIQHLAASKMDLQYWRDLDNLEMREEIVIQNTELKRFNKVFDNKTMFHYFVDKPRIIDAMCKKYNSAMQQGTLTKETQPIPLLIQRPDENGDTALDLAIKLQRPGSFKLMLELLNQLTQSFCVTQSMLDFLPQLIQAGTFINHQFFDQTIYQPPYIQEPLMVRWPQDEDEIVFASKTSIIDGKLVEKLLIKEGILEKLDNKSNENVQNLAEFFVYHYVPLAQKNQFKIGKIEAIDKSSGKEAFKNLQNDHAKILCDKNGNIIDEFGDYEFSENKPKQYQQLQKEHDECHRVYYKDFRPQKYKTCSKVHKVLKVTDEEQQNDSKSRITILCLDFDWLFLETEDGKGNILKLIQICNKSGNSKIFSRKAIQIFIQLLWRKYQYEIRHKIILPYMFYIISFMLYQPFIRHTWEHQPLYEKILLVIILIIGVFLQFYFYRHWIIQYYKKAQSSGILSIFNFMGILKGAQLILSVYVTTQFITDIVKGNPIMDENWKNQLYSILCWLMWLRLYYLMRVYNDKAHFITVITQIVIDIKYLTIMFLIIVSAFANFYYVIDEGDKKAEYIQSYTDNDVINTFIEMYQIAIGNFNTDNYSNGDNSAIIWIFFIMASFIVVIVFMNLLVGIMGNTLNDVTEEQEQSTYQEQSMMIQEYFYLIDLKKEFDGNTYVVYASKQKRNEMSSSDETNQIIKDFQQNLMATLETRKLETIKMDDQLEKGIRIMSKQNININLQIDQLKNKLEGKKHFNVNYDYDEEDDDLEM